MSEIEGFVFCFLNIYAPNRGTERESFFTLLSNELKNTHHDQLIVGGDFNCTLDFYIDRTSGEPHPQSSRSLSNVIIHHDLIDAWRIKHPQTRQYTWVRVRENQVSAVRLDRFYTSKKLINRILSADIIPVGFTDHHLVVINLHTVPSQRFKPFSHLGAAVAQW